MSSYNLDEESQVESFEFVLGGQTYSFRYPTAEEVEELQGLKNGAGDPDAAAIQSKMFEFITPKEENGQPIAEAMKKVKIPVLKAFRNMVNTEFGLEG